MSYKRPHLFSLLPTEVKLAHIFGVMYNSVSRVLESFRGQTLFKLVMAFSRDFSKIQVPGLWDHGTIGPSRSLGPVLSSPGT